MRRSANDQPPRFGPALPNYPLTAQVIRCGVGPDANGVYQALNTRMVNPPNSTTLVTREFCYLTNPNPIGLNPGGIYRSVLMGAYQGAVGLAPLYAAAPCCPSSSRFSPSSSSSSRSSLSSSSSLLSSSSFSAGSGTKSVSSQSSLSAISPSGGCVYSVEARLDWVDSSDLDVYCANLTDGGVCYFGALQAGGLTLNHDAHPICRPTPTQPEVITGTFANDHTFSVWYNQYLNCTPPQTPTTQSFKVTNLGLITIQVFVGASPFPITLTAGQSAVVLSSFAFAGYNTNTQVNFKGGTQVSVVCLGSSSAPSLSLPSLSLPSVSSSVSPTGGGFCCSYGPGNCPNLVLTGSNGTGTCNCFNGLSIVLTGTCTTAPFQWTGTGIEGCTGSSSSIGAVLSCDGTGKWNLSLIGTRCSFGGSNAPATTPCGKGSGAVVLTFPGLTQTIGGCCTVGGHVDWTVTST